MNLSLNRMISVIAAVGLSISVIGCGGAPGESSDSSTGNPNSDGDLVDVSLIPTAASISMEFNTDGTGDRDGIVVPVQAILANLVGHRSFEGQMVEFVAGGGVIEGSCVISEGSRCSVEWTSALNTFSPLSQFGTVGLLAMVPGAAEPFIDANSNGLYDEGEVVTVDYPEPFVDDNASGTWESGEYYFDQNNNGEWDSANGEWDGPCALTSATCNTPNGTTLFDTAVFPLFDSSGELLNRNFVCNTLGYNLDKCEEST